ncbi:hypothetical protein KI387_017525, partial [Taxus chinensis]
MHQVVEGERNGEKVDVGISDGQVKVMWKDGWRKDMFSMVGDEEVGDEELQDNELSLRGIL